MPGGNNKAMNKTYIKFIGSLLIAVIFICTLSKAIPTIVLALDTSADNTVVSHKTMSLDVERLVASGTDINNTLIISTAKTQQTTLITIQRTAAVPVIKQRSAIRSTPSS